MHFFTPYFKKVKIASHSLLLTLAFLLSSAIGLQAQLDPGDIMFVGFVGDGNGQGGTGDLNCEDGFAFAALVDIPANTTIFFTEDNYIGGSFDATEGDVSWSNPAITPSGTIVLITTHVQDGPCPDISTSVGTAQFVTSPPNQWGLSTSNEEIYAYLGAVRNPTVWLSAFFSDISSGDNEIPAELMGFVIDFTLVEQDVDLAVLSNGVNCDNKTDCLAYITDLSNWNTQNTAGAGDCCDGIGVEYPDDLPSSLQPVCEAPVINGINVVNCPEGVNGPITLEVDGTLNGADQWEWTLSTSSNEACESLATTATGQQFTFNAYDAGLYYVRAVGGCLEEPVCFSYTFNPLVGEAAAFSLNTTTYCTNAGIQTGLSGGSPTGGTYSGTGVTDDGNGMTFSFDPSAVVAGNSTTATYTYDSGTECGESTADATIQVAALPTVTFTAPGPFEPDAGLQVLTGGMPTGGVYTGTGVVDNGDGTYAFDPAIGVGTYTITYTLTDGNGCSGSAMTDILIEACILPVINGVNLVSCNDNIVTLEVDGMLNDATQWEWTVPAFDGEDCADQFTIATGNELPGTMFDEPNLTHYVRAVGGCLDETVCFAFIPGEIAGSPNVGGTVALADGTTDITFCIEVDGSNELNFMATGNTGDNFTYLITDQFNNIEAFDDTGVFDFASLGKGAYRIWGLSYSGNLLLEVGDNPGSDAISDQCYDLSENFISITAKIADAGSIGVIGGGSEFSVCLGDGVDDSYSFLFSGSEGSSPFFSSYALTDENNTLLQFSISSPFNFETLAAGNYRVRTVLYTGNLSISLGDDLTTTPISDDCYNFSGNFIAFALSAPPTVTFNPPGPFAPDDGIQALTGGMPEGGAYSGTGVINNGDGTYSFDPSIGEGTYTITYTFTNADNCSNSVTKAIIVGLPTLSGDICFDAYDINGQFGQALNEVQSSGPYDNTNATTDNSDPIFGYECFGEPDGNGGAPSLERTLWYTFTGDGGNYFIEALACGNDPIDFGDTQFAIYSGNDCDNLEAVLCSEDGPNTIPGGPFPAGDTLQTVEGVTYYMMVDGFGPNFPADGEFCVEVTLLEEAIELTLVTFQVDATLLVNNGELAADGIHLAGAFNDFNGEPMTEGANNIWSLTLNLEPGTYTYKFQNGQGNFETIDTSIGDDCTVGGYGDREVTVGDMTITTDLVCYSYCIICISMNDHEASLQANIDIFPNPAKDILTIRIDLPQAADNLSIRLVNAFGQIISDQYFGQIQSDNIELNLSKIPAGAYMLQVRDGQSQFTQSVIVQK